MEDTTNTPKALLRVSDDSNTPLDIPLGAILSMGRGPANDLVLRDNAASRAHAVIRLQSDNVYYLVDLGSANGTFLDGRRITTPMALKPGAQITVGAIKMDFTQDNTPAETQTDDTPKTLVQLRTETVAILVADVRNYTAMCEKLPAQFFSQFIGKWFIAARAIIEEHGGSVDKYIGDAVMALWSQHAFADRAQYAKGPLQTALDLVKIATEFDAELTAAHPTYHFAIGCGIHAGSATIGNVGHFTAVGDCVNVAFRIESLCRPLQRPILLSHDIQRVAGPAFLYEDMGTHELKGKTDKIQVFACKHPT